MRRFFRSVALLLAVVLLPAAHAHEVRPAYLEIGQPDANVCRVVWKQPMAGELALRLIPHLSNGWLEHKPDDQYSSAGFLIRTWTVRPCADDSLAGVAVTVHVMSRMIFLPELDSRVLCPLRGSVLGHGSGYLRDRLGDQTT